MNISSRDRPKIVYIFREFCYNFWGIIFGHFLISCSVWLMKFSSADSNFPNEIRKENSLDRKIVRHSYSVLIVFYSWCLFRWFFFISLNLHGNLWNVLDTNEICAGKKRRNIWWFFMYACYRFSSCRNWKWWKVSRNLNCAWNFYWDCFFFRKFAEVTSVFWQFYEKIIEKCIKNSHEKVKIRQENIMKNWWGKFIW